MVGTTIVSNLLKFIPGFGSIFGGVIEASAAATTTTAFGEAYIVTLTALFSDNDGSPPTNEQVVEAFQKRNQ